MPCLINGSYVVLQKLQQDVPGFNAGVQQIAESLGLAAELTGSKLVGRHKSGCPMEAVLGVGLDASQADPSDDRPELLEDQHINNFGYAADPDGTIVPTAGHIRKAYPRDQANPGEGEAQQHRIMRRGITYGASLPEPTQPTAYRRGVEPDRVERGLLFACYQASIRNQFEFIQQRWVNDATFPTADPLSGIDPILNEADGSTMTIPTAGQPGQQVPLQSWITMKGGAYLFAPGLAGLTILVGPAPAEGDASSGAG